MEAIMNCLGVPLGALIRVCYGICGNYPLAIILFTLLTKIILFPVSMWMQRNNIAMLALTPELNQIKIQFFGDKDTISEESAALYKRKNYHPVVSTVPMIIQLVMLMGVIAAVKEVLGDSGSVLTMTPVQTGGWLLTLPVFAGLTALLLGLSQNKYNPLQKEQTAKEQWASNGLSIAISLFLGFFVSVGVCIYWMSSNIFALLQQFLLNIAVNPKKYIDYKALEDSKKRLEGMNSLSVALTPEQKKREKADYKAFFSVANKHLVFYSESSGFYKYYQGIIEYLLEHSNVVIHYVTGDPNDRVFELAKTNERLRPYFIGEKKLITLMMKMDADIVVMTMPDLENFHIKRSYVRKDVEYIYVCHGIFTTARVLRPNALDHYDTMLTQGDFHDKECRVVEELDNIPPRKLVPCGYTVIDSMAKAYEDVREEKHERPIVLIAPSWQPENILESCLVPLCSSLLEKGYQVIVRPHPQYKKRFPQKFDEIYETCKALPQEHFSFELDFSSNVTVFTADLLVTDWSGIGYEYTLSTCKPVLFINTPMKIVNPKFAEYEKDHPPFDLYVREKMGIALTPEETGTKAGNAAATLLSQQEEYAAAIRAIREEHVYHFGECGKYSAKYILSSLKEKARQKKAD